MRISFALLIISSAITSSPLPKPVTAQVIPVVKSKNVRFVSPRPTTLKAAILDTGFDPALVEGTTINLCDSGHYDFYSQRPIIASTHPHGTAVALAASEELKGVDYCFIIIQLNSTSGLDNTSIVRGIKHVRPMRLAAANLSISGVEASHQEKFALEALANSGVKIFVAAGNERENFNKACKIYPACYRGIKGMTVVGALTPDLRYVAPYSNFGGGIDLWYSGEVELPMGVLQGTSFASPRAMGNYLRARSQP